jgi:hypothetical protein
VPVPDPTTLTQISVDAAKEDLRREMTASALLYQRDIQRIDDVLDSLTKAVELSPGQRDDLRIRLQGDIEHAVATAREHVLSEIRRVEDVTTERFTGIAQQFVERDTRGEQEKKAAKEALDAALLAQKESVSQQNDANTTAATKSETSFTKQIDQVGTLITTLDKSWADRFAELKERIDRGEGGTSGVHEERAERRGSNSANLAYALAALYVVSAVVAIVVALSHH